MRIRHYVLASFLALPGTPAHAQQPTDETDTMEPVSVAPGENTSTLIDFSVLLDFGSRPIAPLFARHATAQPVNFLWDKTLPVKLEDLADEPQFAPYVKATISELEQYTTAMPDDANAWTVLGVRLYQTNQIAQSIAALTRAREADPLHERSAELYSAILIQAGNMDEALLQVRLMLDTLPHNRILRFNAACGYALNTNVAEALQHLSVLADLGWREVRFFLEDRDLDNIRKTPEFERLVTTLDQRAREWAVAHLRTTR